MRLKVPHEMTFSLKASVGYMLRKCNNYELSTF